MCDIDSGFDNSVALSTAPDSKPGAARLRIVAWLLACVLPLLASPARADDGRGATPALPRVQVAEPYVAWHTGPAAAYPVVRVSEQGEWLTLVRRKTDWFRVRDRRGREGWVHVDDVLLTLDGAGEPVTLTEPRFDDFSTRRWEAGLMMGEFDRAPVTAVYAGYWMTANLSLELWGSQALGTASEILMVSGNLVHQPFPDWRVSPFFTLGYGHIAIRPKTTLADTENRDNPMANAGLGVRFYMTDRYFLRAEVKDFKTFTDRQTNEEATEWKLGLSIFF
ncbi:SH3 domain-containing protein [Marinobacter xestospongiae]|uniref:SH3 domain-containing protein n=1 Tax=Marinobacter xestospongiae TaxID=994319 RepID=A0ABU3VSH7_9GAMM|nr:SH3 domain-containing protein [Marinobacter xestospongiae]MDV2077214.1 SH3 domain-containing protein [Marinobacter xestospongiae]